jgi:hypothetical protein
VRGGSEGLSIDSDYQIPEQGGRWFCVTILFVERGVPLLE